MRPDISHRLCTSYATIGHHIVSCHQIGIGQGTNSIRREYETHPNCSDLYHFQEGHGDREMEKNWICFIIESFNLVVTSPLVIISNHMEKLPCFMHSNKKCNFNSFFIVPMFFTKKDERYG